VVAEVSKDGRPIGNLKRLEAQQAGPSTAELKSFWSFGVQAELPI